MRVAIATQEPDNSSGELTLARPWRISVHDALHVLCCHPARHGDGQQRRPALEGGVGDLCRAAAARRVLRVRAPPYLWIYLREGLSLAAVTPLSSSSSSSDRQLD